MISDVLHDAVAEMDRYLDSPEWHGMYTGQTRKELKALRTLMDAARQRLDTPPAPEYDGRTMYKQNVRRNIFDTIPREQDLAFHTRCACDQLRATAAACGASKCLTCLRS